MLFLSPFGHDGLIQLNEEGEGGGTGASVFKLPASHTCTCTCCTFYFRIPSLPLLFPLLCAFLYSKHYAIYVADNIIIPISPSSCHLGNPDFLPSHSLTSHRLLAPYTPVFPPPAFPQLKCFEYKFEGISHFCPIKMFRDDTQIMRIKLVKNN